MYPSVDRSTVYNSQDMEATYMSISRRMDKKAVVHVYTEQYYSAIKINESLPFATIQMDLEGVVLSEISQRKKILCITCMWNLKRKTN